MSAMQRRKGANGERELAALLREELGDTVTRNLDQCRDGGAGGDLLGVHGFALEVKRAARARLSDWWSQTLDQAAQCGRIPALAYRLDRRDWRFIVPMAAISGDFSAQPHTLDLSADISLDGFCLLVRNTL